MHDVHDGELKMPFIPVKVCYVFMRAVDRQYKRRGSCIENVYTALTVLQILLRLAVAVLKATSFLLVVGDDIRFLGQLRKQMPMYMCANSVTILNFSAQ